MGRPGVFHKPDLAGREHREFNDALHHLHLLAGLPSLTEPARDLRDAGMSRSSIHDAFSSPRLPRWQVVLDGKSSSMASRRCAHRDPHVQSTRRHGRAAAGTDACPLDAGTHYSDRDDAEQHYLRRTLYGIVDRILTASGIDEIQLQRADRGDSFMELIATEASLIALLRTLLTEVPLQLRAVNRMTANSAQLRLRAVLSTGHVAVDELGGWVGYDLNRACRLLDAEFPRTASRERDDGFAPCVSDSVYDGTVRHGRPGFPPEGFRQVAFNTEYGASTA